MCLSQEGDLGAVEQLVGHPGRRLDDLLGDGHLGLGGMGSGGVGVGGTPKNHQKPWKNQGKTKKNHKNRGILAIKSQKKSEKNRKTMEKPEVFQVFMAELFGFPAIEKEGLWWFLKLQVGGGMEEKGLAKLFRDGILLKELSWLRFYACSLTLKVLKDGMYW